VYKRQGLYLVYHYCWYTHCTATRLLRLVTMANSEAQGADYEAQHVHSVYEEIAGHFSSTRYKVCVT